MASSGCAQFHEKIHPLLDGELNAAEAAAMRAHMAECEGCRQEYEQLCGIRDMLAHMDDDVEAPIAFERGWRSAVRHEGRARRSRKWVRLLSGVAAAVLLLTGATVINRSSGRLPRVDANGQVITMAAEDGPSMRSMPADYGAAQNDILPQGEAENDDDALMIASDLSGIDSAGYTQPPDFGSTAARYHYSKNTALSATSSGGLLDVDERRDGGSVSSIKVLRSALLKIETENFDDDLSAIKSVVAKFGGLFERNAMAGDTGSRRAELTLRVPAGFLEAFVEQLRPIGRVLESEISAEDITSQYTDVALRLDTCRAQLRRVQELTAQAKDLNEVLELEKEASKLQYSIDKLTGRLNGWDGKTEMSIVSIVLSEYSHVEASLAGSGFTRRIGAQFGESMQEVKRFFGDMTLTLIAFLPHLLWLLPLCFIAFAVSRALKQRRLSFHGHTK